MSFQFIPFVITPDELKMALKSFTLFIGNKSVPIEYISTSSDVFFNNYTNLYECLCNGEVINHRVHNGILDYFFVTTDISSVQFGKEHMYLNKQYKMYLGTTRGYAPHFLPFTFNVYEEKNKIFVTTRGTWLFDNANIMGFQIAYPKLTKLEAMKCGVTSEKDLESYSDYKIFKDFVLRHTSEFKFVMNGIEKKTQIRVSSEAKKMLPNFHCIKKFGIEVL